MRIHDGSDWKSEGELTEPIEWLESMQRIRNRLVVVEGLLSSLVLEQTVEGRERIGKALESAAAILDTVDHLTDSMKEQAAPLASRDRAGE